MSRQINQPINQVRLTNVAVVRTNRGGKRFEIACYRSKVMDYRRGLETDIDEVLQTDRIFTNVSKGQFANEKDLEQCFEGIDNIFEFILRRGTLQVSDLERQQTLEQAQTQIATWISRHCVHPTSQRPYTISQIRNAMTQAAVVVSATKAMKRQYLECVKALKKVLPIERAKMELALEMASADCEEIRQVLLEQHGIAPTRVTTDETNTTTTLVFLVDPSLYRVLDDVAKLKDNNNTTRLEILQQQVVMEGDVDLEFELERKRQAAAAKDEEEEEEQLRRGKQQQQQQQQQEEAATAQAEEDVDYQPKEEKIVAGSDSKDDEEEQDNNGAHEDQDEDDDDYFMTMQQQQSKKSKKKKAKRLEKLAAQLHAADDDDSDDNQVISMLEPWKQQQQEAPKKQQGAKKSKKAKRREKEQAAELQARLQMEEQRQMERAQRQGTTATVPQAPTKHLSANDGSKSCNTCGGSFETAADYRAHFRTDWHRYNQKLKLQGIPPITEHEFKLCDADTFLLSTT